MYTRTGREGRVPNPAPAPDSYQGRRVAQYTRVAWKGQRFSRPTRA